MRSRQQIQDLSIIEALAPTEAQWREAAISFFRSWIEMFAIEDNDTSKGGPNSRTRENFFYNISADEISSDLRVPAHSR